MAQHDYNIANDSGLGVRTDLNALFMAIATQNSGDSEPNPTYPLQWWADTLTGYLKQRNTANDAWLIRWDLTKGQLATLYSPTFGGQVNLPTTTFINGNAVATLVAPNFSGNSVFEKLTAWSDVSLPASTTIGGVSPIELSYLDGVTSSIQSQLNVRALLSGATFTGNIIVPNATAAGHAINKSQMDTSMAGVNISGIFSNSQIFTSSGTFTVPAGITRVLVFIASGGGGGGGGKAVNSGTSASGGGGGASAFFPPLFVNVTPSENIAVTVGAGGVGGAGLAYSQAYSVGTGGKGGSSSFKSITYEGGSGGIGANATAAGGNAGANTGGIANSSGSPHGGLGNTGPTNGNTGTGSAGGIGGTSSINNGVNGVPGVNGWGGAGGTGGAGKIIVYW